MICPKCESNNTHGTWQLHTKEDEEAYKCDACGTYFVTKKESTKMTRQNWDEYFMNIAQTVSTRATCPRASVGAVIVKNNRIISTGYNGAPAGEPHCTEVGCLMENDHCQRAIHAETNAVVQAARFGLPIDGATLYYWDSLDRPADSCVKCSQVMKAAGIARIVGNAK